MRTLCALLMVTASAAMLPAAELQLRFAPREEGGEGIKASGVMLDGERLVTVAVVGADPARAKLKSGEALPLIAHDPVTRLTILRASASKSGTGESARKLGRALGLQAGTAVYLPGESVRASRVVRWENSYDGKILPVSLIRVHHPWNEPPLPGTPLFNEKRELIAICHQAAPKFGNGTFALPVEVLQKILANVERSGRILTCWIGVTVNAINPVLAVEMVRPNSPGAQAGVKKGDILLSIGPRPVSTYADARDAFYYMIPNQATRLVLLRGTKRLEVQVIPEIHPALAPARDE